VQKEPIRIQLRTGAGPSVHLATDARTRVDILNATDAQEDMIQRAE
jgi:hypothetical protein